jgi:hypothetical protein
VEEFVIAMMPPYTTAEDAKRLARSVPDNGGAEPPVWHERVIEDGRRVLVTRNGREASIRPVE